MVREAKELAKQRAELEAALAAERGDAQGHGYTPTPLVTPKPIKVSLVVQPFMLGLEALASLVNTVWRVTQGQVHFEQQSAITGARGVS